MVADNEAKIRISAQDEASKAIESLAGNVEGFKKTIIALGLAMAAAIPVVALVKGLKECVDAAAAEEQGIIKLATAVKNSGANWDEASVAIEKYLAAEMRRTALDDGAGRAAIQALTETTGDYKKALSLMSVAQDMATAKGMDLATAALIVGRVAQGNTGILARYGIDVKGLAKASGELVVDTQAVAAAQEDAAMVQRKAAISLAEIGDKMKKLKPESAAYQKLLIQREEVTKKVAAAEGKVAAAMQGTINTTVTAEDAIKALSDKFSGQAAALANTYPGQLKKFEIAMGNLKETIGAAMLPVLANLAGKLADFAMNAMPIAEKAAGLLGKAFGYVGAQVRMLFNVFAIGMKTGGIGGAFKALSGSILRMVGVSEPAIAKISGIIGKLADSARTLVNVFSGGMKMGGISQGLKDVMDVFANMLGIGPQVKSSIAGIGGSLSSLATAVSGTFAKIIGIITGPGDIGAKFVAMVSLADNALTSLRVAILDKVATIIPALLPTLTALAIKIISWVLDAVPGIITNLAIFASKIVTTIGTILPSIVTAAGKLALVLVQWVADATPGLLTNLSKLISVLLITIGAILPPLVTMAAKLALVLVQWVINAIPGLLANLGKLINTLLSTIGTLLPKLLVIVGNFAKALIGWVLDALPGLLSSIGKFAQGAISALMSYLPGWIASLAKFAIEMVQWVVAQLPALAENLGKFFNAMVKWVVDELPTWIAELKKLALAIVQWVIDALPDLATNLGKVVGALIKWAGETAIEIVPELLKIAGAFLAWVGSDVIPKLPGVLATIVVALLKFINGIVSQISPDLGKVGEGMIQGLIDGVNRAAKKLEDAIRGAELKSREGLINQLLMHSPSKVYAEIGLNMMRGLAEGLEQGEADALTKVAEMVSSIASAFEGMLNLGTGISGATLPDVGPFAAWLESSATVLTKALDRIGGVPGTEAAGLVVHAKDVANVLGDIIRGITVDFAAFTLPKALPDLGAWAGLLEQLITEVSGVVESLTTDLGPDKINRAAEAAPLLGTLLGAIGNMVSGMTAVSGFASISGLANSIESLVADARLVSKKLVEYFSIWTKTTLDNVTNAGIAATAMGNLLSPARTIIDGVTAIAGYTAAKDIEASWTALYWDMRAVAIRMTAYFDTWTETTLINVTKATQGATAMGTLLTPLKAIVDGVLSIVGYHKAADPEGAWTALYWDMRGISIRMVAYFDSWKDSTLTNVNKAAIGADAMGKLFASTRAIIDGVTAIGSYVAAKDIKTSIKALVTDMNIVRDALIEAFESIAQTFLVIKDRKKLGGGQMPDTTQTSGNASDTLAMINTLLTPIKGIIDAVSAVSGYVAGINVKNKVRSLIVDIGVIRSALIEAFTVTVGVITDVIKETKKLTSGQMPDLTQVASDATTTLTGINALLAPIKGIIDALGALSSYQPVQNLAMAVKLMTRDVLDAMENLKEGLKDIKGDLLDSIKTAGEAAVAVGALFGPIKSIIDTLIAIAGYKQSSNLVDATAGLMQDLWDTVFILRDQFYVIGQKSGETLPIAATAATIIGSIYSATKGTIDALTAIVDYKQSKNLADAVAAVMTDIWTTIFNLRDLFGSIARDAGSTLSSAATAAQVVMAILKATKEIVTSLTDVAGLENIAGLDNAVTGIANAITRLVKALAGNAEGAANMGIAATSLTALATALKNFTELAQWSSGILTGLPMFGILFNSKLGTATTIRADVYVHVGGDGKAIIVQNNGQVSGVVNDQLVTKIIQAVNMQLGSQAHNSLALQTRAG